MFIVSLTYKCAMEDVEKHLEAHMAYLKQEYARGSFILSGRKIPRTGGVLLSILKNREELEAILERDPFYQHNIAAFEVTEFHPGMAAEGYEILLEE